MYRKFFFRFFVLLFIVLFTGSCTSIKNIAYLQPAATASQTPKQVGTTADVFNALIKPKDLLSITVVTSVPEASRMYKLL